jgi:hypothetical protein
MAGASSSGCIPRGTMTQYVSKLRRANRDAGSDCAWGACLALVLEHIAAFGVPCWATKAKETGVELVYRSRRRLTLTVRQRPSSDIWQRSQIEVSTLA